MTLARFARRWRLWRPIVLAVLLAALVGGALSALRPVPEGNPTLVAVRAVSTGDAFSREDVREVRIPDEARAEDALDIDAPLPGTWVGPDIAAGTVLTDSVVAASASARELSADEVRLSVSVGTDQVQGLAPGDVVDVWAPPQTCAENSCAASLLAENARITSILVDGGSSWGSPSSAHTDLVLREQDVDLVLGHAGTGMLALVLHPTGTVPDRSSMTGDLP